MPSRRFVHTAKAVREYRASHENVSQLDMGKLFGFKNGQAMSNIERGIQGFTERKLHLIDDVEHREKIILGMVKDYEDKLRRYANENNKA